jgi:DNA-binding Xre family transcriptional regulator
MKWNLRLAAAKRDIWQASDMHRLLAEHGLVISKGKMSNLWSSQPITVRLDDLDVICTVLDCTPAELLLPEPDKVRQQPQPAETQAKAVGAVRPLPRPRTHRSLPPE